MLEIFLGSCREAEVLKVCVSTGDGWGVLIIADGSSRETMMLETLIFA
jgi:hypothetical protein